MKIVVVGLGYVGLSNAVLLAQHNEVLGVDVSQERVDMINSRKSPIIDPELSQYLAEKDLNLKAHIDLKDSVKGADYIIVSTPTNYDENTNFFDTSSVEAVIAEVIEREPNACIVVKSTVPVGFIDGVKRHFNINSVMFSPEFLREGRALYDNLHPSRIVVGEKSDRAEVFANLLAQGALKRDVELLFTGAREAEAIKLFSNAYLAMRIAYINELDSFALAAGMNSREIIDGVSLDPRIGNYYNNPSFGYGGYCLPKDTKQLLSNYDTVPQNIISAIVDSNSTRKNFLSNEIYRLKPNIVGVYRLSMKEGSDNFRDSAILGIMQRLQKKGVRIIIYEPNISAFSFQGFDICQDLSKFKRVSDVIITNRIDKKLSDYSKKVFSRDIYGTDI